MFFSKKMVSISGDLPILRFLEKPHVFSKKNGLNIGWPAHLKIFRKTPRFFLKNGLNIGWPAHLKIFRKTPRFF